MRIRLWQLFLIVAVVAIVLQICNLYSHGTLEVRVVSVQLLPQTAGSLMPRFKGDFCMNLAVDGNQLDGITDAIADCQFGNGRYSDEPVTSTNVMNLQGKTFRLKYRAWGLLWLQADQPAKIFREFFDQPFTMNFPSDIED